MNRELRDSIIFLSPLILIVSIFILFPVIGTFWVSLWQDVSFLPKKFIGFGNYLRLFQDTQFLQSLLFTLIFSLTSVMAEIILGTMVALVINEKFSGRGILRGIVLLPWAIPGVVGARIWQLIYQYDYGVANYVLRELSGLPINW